MNRATRNWKIGAIVMAFFVIGTYASLIIPLMAQQEEVYSSYGLPFGLWTSLFFYTTWRGMGKPTGRNAKAIAVLGWLVGICVFEGAFLLAGYS